MVRPFMRYRMGVGCCECAALPGSQVVPAPWSWQHMRAFRPASRKRAGRSCRSTAETPGGTDRSPRAGAGGHADDGAGLPGADEQPQRTILERARALSNLKNQAAEARYRQTLQSETASAEEARRARAGLNAITLELRQEAFGEIEAAIGPQQAAVERRLRGLGATRIGRYKGINMLTAEVPGGALAALEADAAIARVWPVEKLESQIVHSVPAIGAPAFWTNGYTGQGESVAVLDSGVRTNHPAFAGKTIDSAVFLSYGSTFDRVSPTPRVRHRTWRARDARGGDRDEPGIDGGKH